MGEHVAPVTNIRNRIKPDKPIPPTDGAWPASPPLPDDSGTFHVECIMTAEGTRPSVAALMFAEVSTYAASRGVTLTWKEKVTKE